MSVVAARYNLNGIAIGPEKGRYAATDGHRLATNAGPEIPGLDKSIIVPRKRIERVLSFLSISSDCQIFVDDTMLHVCRVDCSIAIRLIDGVFPDVNKVIPTEKPACEIVCDREALLQALRRVRLVATDETKSVRLKVLDGSVELQSISPELGEATDRIAADCQAWDTKVAFNGKYLGELLSSSKADQVSIGLFSDVGPGLFRFVGVVRGYYAG